MRRSTSAIGIARLLLAGFAGPVLADGVSEASPEPVVEETDLITGGEVYEDVVDLEDCTTPDVSNSETDDTPSKKTRRSPSDGACGAHGRSRDQRGPANYGGDNEEEVDAPAIDESNITRDGGTFTSPVTGGTLSTELYIIVWDAG